MADTNLETPPAEFDAAPFYASLTGDDKAFVERKGLMKPGENGKLPSPVELARGWANAEKLIGVNRLPEPDLSDDAKRASWEGWDKLGAPKDGAGYKFERPQMPKGLDGQPIAYDEAAEKSFRDLATKLRMPQFMFDAVMKDETARRMASLASGVQDITTQKTAIETNLRKDFGAGYDGAKEQARSALVHLAKEAKLDAGKLADFASHEFGSEETARLFITLGKMLGEGTLKGGKEAGFTPSMSDAKAEIERLKTDPNFQAAFTDKGNTGHRAAMERWERLNVQAMGG